MTNTLEQSANSVGEIAQDEAISSRYCIACSKPVEPGKGYREGRALYHSLEEAEAHKQYMHEALTDGY